MEEIILAILIILFVIIFGAIFRVFTMLAQTNAFVYELSNLVSRTFREYYKGENMEPIVTGQGIDILWKEDGESEFGNQGFISICVSDTTNVSSPIKDHKDADIIAGKIINIINDYIVEE